VFAIIEASGKQYPVETGIFLALDSWIAPEGEQVTFDRVLLAQDGEKILVGKPYVEGLRVRGTVMQLRKGKKVVVFKYKPKVNYRKKQGHRKGVSIVRIDQIEVAK